MGSKSDWTIMKNTCETLKSFHINYDVRVISAHRTPKRLEKFINIVGKDRVIAGSDCGFGTFAGYGNVDEDIVFEKLKSMVEAAKRF